MKQNYITAIVALLASDGDVDRILGELRSVLAKKGHQRLYKGILHGVVHELLQKQKTSASFVTVSQHSDAKAYEAEIKSAFAALQAPQKDHLIKTDPSIIGGFIASSNGKRVDHSYKGKLVSLYRSITT